MKYYNCIDSIKVESKELEDIVNNNNLSLFFNTKDGGIAPNHVGFILKKDFIISIYPKNFLEDKEFKHIGKIDKSFELLSKVLIEMKKKSGIVDEKKEINNFPLKAYLNICQYYLNHGLYLETNKHYRKGFGGKINWNRTINKSNKIISKNKNLLFTPFIIEKNNYKDVFITESMKYVLSHGYKNFGYYFRVGVPYKEPVQNRIMKNEKYVIKRLKLLKVNYFKDIEKHLIDNLITYFRWKNKFSEDGFLLTNSFNNYWEVMVKEYLNNNLDQIRVSNNMMYFKDDVSNYNFEKKENKILSRVDILEDDVEKDYTLEYDHFYKKDNIIYLFDSKYYIEVKGLDYKQVFYNIYLKEKFSDHIIVNGLIIPTNKEYHTKIHFNPISLDYGYLNDIYITEHYLNLKRVVTNYLK